MNPND